MTYYNTKSDCALDLMLTYGRFASIRLSKIINEKELLLGRRLFREEVLAIYHQIDEDLCQKILTRASK